MSGKRIAKIGILSAAALVISLFESLLPPILPVLPFARVGISQIIVFAALIILDFKDAFIVLLVRTVLAAVFMGNPQILLYSLPAGIISLCLMAIFLRTRRFGLPAISSMSGAVHNLMQIVSAALITGTFAVFAYLPYLMVFGSVAGAVTGIVCAILIKKLPENLLKSNI